MRSLEHVAYLYHTTQYIHIYTNDFTYHSSNSLGIYFLKYLLSIIDFYVELTADTHDDLEKMPEGNRQVGKYQYEIHFNQLKLAYMPNYFILS